MRSTSPVIRWLQNHPGCSCQKCKPKYYLEKISNKPNWGTFGPKNLTSSLGKCKGRGTRPLVLGLCGSSEFWPRQQQTKNDSGTSSRMQKIRGPFSLGNWKAVIKLTSQSAFYYHHVWAILNSVPDKTLLPRKKKILFVFVPNNCFSYCGVLTISKHEVSFILAHF